LAQAAQVPARLVKEVQAVLILFFQLSLQLAAEAVEATLLPAVFLVVVAAVEESQAQVAQELPTKGLQVVTVVLFLVLSEAAEAAARALLVLLGQRARRMAAQG
jgi:hypothetical protein